ncbi:lactate dehydrogenase [Arthrobacter sp. TPD3018]|uniref:class I SAM-dependent DNA methyltransferase n=2 Tax=cellular organisms TaxID=131567 RepID=UPI000D50C869|nr:MULTISPECIES: DNA methyltransferase [Sphingomonas]PVE52036.1 lactate dehydrogenase [Arthrobacter sp. TPD3018]PVE54595.1 lactate dehydrogenase [Sphingomonas sp. TPD3009]PVE82855.1 lactate dehydrogenase [Sphingomonas melonis]
MNAVEIEEAVSDLVQQQFDAAEFPFQFITAFGAKKATVDRLRATKNGTNQSDVGGVLQRNNIHIGIAPAGEVGATLAALRASPKTVSAKAKFLLATDGETVEGEDLVGGDVIACPYSELPRHFATFLPLAGISTVKEIKNNPIDVKATGRLNKLYVELLKDNPDWAIEERRHELNQFMARLIFCFFAEDTGIFRENQFTATITQMSYAGHGGGDEQWGNTHEVLTELFRAMDTPVTHQGNLDERYRRAAGIRPYADVFPYVNGGLFTGATESPRFSRTARAYLLRAGELDWKEINPDIFGSMIQAVADDGERGELGMHYTSVPNILKVLNPLFLDGLRGQLEAARDSRQKLRNLRRRLSNIRVFDPACGSGNFLVIAYKEMRAIEAVIVERLGGEANLKLDERRSVIPLSNFYGIEIKGFAAEIARLALLIAEFQADCLYLSQQEARAMVLPLHKTGQITVGNALREDWLEVCPPVRVATGVEPDLAGPTGRLALEDIGTASDASVETYVCGNPPYKGYNKQTEEQKGDLRRVFDRKTDSWKSLDYVSGWFQRYASLPDASWRGAFVATNSICQGEHASILWPVLLAEGVSIKFAVPNFRWANNAAKNAVVTVSVLGLTRGNDEERSIYDDGLKRDVTQINRYLVPAPDVNIQPTRNQISGAAYMDLGNMPKDGGHLLLEGRDKDDLLQECPGASRFIFDFVGSQEYVKGVVRQCIWIEDHEVADAMQHSAIARRLHGVQAMRLASEAESTRAFANKPHRFKQIQGRGRRSTIVVPKVTSELRPYLPVGLLSAASVVSDNAFALYDAPIWNMALIASRLHLVWIATVCGKLETRYRYSNTLGWNTFPVPKLTEQDKADLTRTGENILLAREAHFPATIADLYDPENMPDDLRRAHEENDEVLERIYIGRRFRNDTERLEKLFDLYTKMTANAASKGKSTKKSKAA